MGNIVRGGGEGGINSATTVTLALCISLAADIAMKMVQDRNVIFHGHISIILILGREGVGWYLK